MKDVKLAMKMGFFIRNLRYILLLLNKTTLIIILGMFVHKHLTCSLELSSDSFTTFTAAERQLKGKFEGLYSR